jgi:hypothetical protein
MDRKYFVEYENNEQEQYEKYASISERIPKLMGPVSNLTFSDSSIWSQIAFSGTVVFPLSPMDETLFKKMYNISVNEIPDLVKFVKETKKVQFVLTDAPTLFSGYDYLDPIFEELAPPVYALSRNHQNDALQDSYDRASEDLDLLLDIVLRNIPDNSMKQHVHQDYIRNYAYLDYFGFTDANELFIEMLLDNPNLATNYIELSYNLLAHPIIDPFKANPVIPLEMISKIGSFNNPSLKEQKNVIIPEVGSFLLRKTTHYPDSLSACKCVISNYNKNDLYSVYSALNEAIIDKNSTAIIENTTELEEIMDNVWNDTDIIRQNKMVYKLGIDVICGMVGVGIAGLGGGLVGVLCGAAGTTNSLVLDNFAELIAKKVATPYMVTIYDFQNKIPLNHN